jgi:hypothetical protein
VDGLAGPSLALEATETRRVTLSAFPIANRPFFIRAMRRGKLKEAKPEPAAEKTSRLTIPSFPADDSSALGAAMRMA